MAAKAAGLLGGVVWFAKTAVEKGVFLLARINKEEITLFTDWDDPGYDRCINDAREVKKSKQNRESK